MSQRQLGVNNLHASLRTPFSAQEHDCGYALQEGTVEEKAVEWFVVQLFQRIENGTFDVKKSTLSI